MLFWTALRLVLVLTLLVALPGFLLVQACFPPRRTHLGGFERAFLAAAGGVLLVTLVGVVLGFLPHGERGFYSTLATGLPNAELALLAVSGLLLWVGIQRGAYPKLEARLKARRQAREGQAQRAGLPRQ